MRLDKANQRISLHVGLGSGYNRDAVRRVLGEVDRDHRQVAMNQLISDYKLEENGTLNPAASLQVHLPNKQ